MNMPFDANTPILERAGARLGFGGDLTPEAVTALQRYASLIVLGNARQNLTRILRADEIATRHFLDSLGCLRGLGRLEGADLRCVDVGAGAGLPGIPLKIVRPGWRMSLVESMVKKAMFLEKAVGPEGLGLDGVEVLRMRAEELGQAVGHRQSYDLAVARAVSRMSVLAEYLLPLVKVGGRCLALKGADARAEVEAAMPAIELLGGRLVEVAAYSLPGVTDERFLVVIEKVGVTPGAYPRRAGVPAKRPLG
jgi:16S rRNA (guanine527-N7)-methyltransferase